MIKVLNLENAPLSDRNGSYGGAAGSKEGILIDREYWLVKYPKSTRSMRGTLLSYTTSALSEYIGSHIYSILGYSVHETKLGIRNGKCALPGFVDSKNEEKTERNAGYLVVSHSGGGMLRQGTRKGIRRTPANRGMRAHRIVKSLDISEDVCHGLCP